MNILSACEKPQVLQFKTQEAPTLLKVITTNEVKERIIAHNDMPAVIKVMSMGGAGGNALNRMIEASLAGIEFVAVNTDVQDLYKKSKAEIKVQIGVQETGGRGAGGEPEKGEKAALEDQAALADALKGADMVFLTAGMGGGTGTGSIPIAARIAKQLGALTVAVVTMPFEFEGRHKMAIAEAGLLKLRKEVDTLIVIPNQHLFKIIDNTISYNKAYMIADEVLCRGVQGISELITDTGFQNVDFADVEAIMKGKGDALLGIGFGTGENRALDAVKSAINNPLLEDTSIEGATGVLINIKGPEDITLVEIQNIIKTVKEQCDLNVNIIHGLCNDPKLENSIQITVIATGFMKKNEDTLTHQTTTVKASGVEYIDYNEYVKMVEKTKKPEFLSYLPQREDELDVPSVLRKHNYHTEEKPVMETAEKK